MKKYITTAAALAAIITLSGCSFTNSTSSEGENSSNQSTSKTESKESKTYTADEFCALFNEDEDFARHHSDEKFTVKFTIAKKGDIGLSDIDFRSSVKSKEYGTEFLLTCKLDDKSLLSDLHKGDTITVTGSLFSFATSGIVLQDCTLDNVEKGDYKPTSVKIADHKISKDYKGAEVLVVTYEFYNGEETDEAFAYNFTDNAYQNGVECDDLVIGCDDVDAQTQLNKIQPGITYNVVVGYHISDRSDVSIKVKDWIGDEIHLEETISIS